MPETKQVESHYVGVESHHDINFRCGSEILNALLAEAFAQNLTLNNLIDRILRKHLQFDVTFEKYGLVSLRREWYKNLLESVNERQFIERTRADAEQLRDFLMVKYKQANLHSLCDSIKALGHYSKLWDTAYEIDGYKYTLALHHNFGRKHSLLLGTSVQSILSAIGLEAAATKLSDSTVVIEFDASSLPSKWR